MFLRQETLWGVTFDVGSLELEGEPTPLLDGVTRFSVSEDGTLAYIALGQFSGQVVAWVDREGVEIGPIGSPGSFRNPELSPDGTKLAVMSNGDIWVYDLERGVSTRITFEGQDAAAIWSPDGSRLAFSSSREGSFKLFEVPADGSGEVVKLFESPDGEGIGPLHWSSDGQYLIFGTGLGNRGIRYLTDGDSVTVLDTDFDEYQAEAVPGRSFPHVRVERVGPGTKCMSAAFPNRIENGTSRTAAVFSHAGLRTERNSTIWSLEAPSWKSPSRRRKDFLWERRSASSKRVYMRTPRPAPEPSTMCPWTDNVF